MESSSRWIYIWNVVCDIDVYIVLSAYSTTIRWFLGIIFYFRNCHLQKFVIINCSDKCLKRQISVSSTKETFISHIEPGSLLIHDKEHSHSVLIKELNLKDESYDSKYLSKLDDKDNPLSEVNNLCFLLKKFLNSHSSFNRKDLQNYLNLFSFMVNKPYNKLEKVKILLDKAICNPKTLHYRDCYSKK